MMVSQKKRQKKPLMEPIHCSEVKTYGIVPQKIYIYFKGISATWTFSNIWRVQVLKPILANNSGRHQDQFKGGEVLRSQEETRLNRI